MPRTPRAAATEPEATPALAFCLNLARANAVVTTRLDRALSSLHGLGFGDFLILYHLSRAPEQRLRRIDLAQRLELTASGVTRSLLPLEKRGLVARQDDPRDARATFACLAKPGQRLLANALVAAEQIGQEATRAVPADQLAPLSVLLGELAGLNLTNS